MFQRRILFVLIVMAVLCVPSAPYAQDRSSRDDDVLSLDSDLVPVDITVVDERGNYVTDLKEGEVRLFVDGKPQPIDFFDPSTQRGLTRPLAVVFALDVSGSITPKELVLQRDSAMRFVDLVRPESLFSVIAFNHEVKVLQKFTNKARDVGKAFGKVEDAGGSTRLLDTLDQAVTMLSKTPTTRGGRRLRRVVVVITDGYDSSSVINPIELIRRAEAADVTVYSITLPSYQMSLTGERVRLITILDATRVVPATGGKDFSADTNDYTPIFRAIAEEIAAGYQIAFYPPEAIRRDGKLHELRVEVTRPGVQVRTSRQGFQAPRP